jgi:beta-glucanase (GH16 family)
MRQIITLKLISLLLIITTFAQQKQNSPAKVVLVGNNSSPITIDVLFDGSLGPPSIGPYNGQWNQTDPSIPAANQPIWFPQNPWGNEALNPASCSNKNCLRLPSNIIYESNNQWLKIRSTNVPTNGYAYTSGRLFSNALRRTYQYGYFEIVAKAPPGFGIGGTFWLFAENTDSDGTGQEIDITEFQGWNPEVLPTNYHKSGSDNALDVRYFPVGSPINFNTSFNKIALEWTPTTLTWYVNDSLVRQVTNHGISQPMNIIVDVNCPYGGACPVAAAFPNYYYIKSVKWFSQKPTVADFQSTDCQGGLKTIKSFNDWRKTWDQLVPGDFDNDNLTDVFLYDRANGAGHFYNSSGNGTTLTGLRTTWDIIVPGNFGSNSGNTDLLFYDRTAGQAEFHSVSPAGSMGSIGGLNTGWRKTWDQIVPGDFDNDNLTDLLFYDKTNGVCYFKRSGAADVTYNNWRKTWDKIIPGNFGGNTTNTDLLFYDRTAGQGQFHSVYPAGNMGSIGALNTGWRKTWDQIVPGDFNPSKNTDLLFYDKSVGQAYFFNVSNGGLASTIANYNDWRTTWSLITPGNFDGANCNDLLFYDRQ